MEKVLIMIPSYKRDSILDFTLENLCNNTERGIFDVEIVVGLNKATREQRDIVIERRRASESKNFVVNYVEFEKNIGKAECLNTIVDRYFRDHRFIVNLDNDMWVKDRWLKMLEHLSTIDYDMVGFGGTHFWPHVPRIDDTYEKSGPYRLYRRDSIAGGFSLYSREFIKKFKFFGHDRVYGGVDGHSCTQAVKKFVMYWDIDWLEHDPLCRSTRDLRKYQDKKSYWLSKNIIFFPEGWDD